MNKTYVMWVAVEETFKLDRNYKLYTNAWEVPLYFNMQEKGTAIYFRSPQNSVPVTLLLHSVSEKTG